MTTSAEHNEDKLEFQSMGAAAQELAWSGLTTQDLMLAQVGGNETLEKADETPAAYAAGFYSSSSFACPKSS